MKYFHTSHAILIVVILNVLAIGVVTSHDDNSVSTRNWSGFLRGTGKERHPQVDFASTSSQTSNEFADSNAVVPAKSLFHRLLGVWLMPVSIIVEKNLEWIEADSRNNILHETIQPKSTARSTTANMDNLPIVVREEVSKPPTLYPTQSLPIVMMNDEKVKQPDKKISKIDPKTNNPLFQQQTLIKQQRDKQASEFIHDDDDESSLLMLTQQPITQQQAAKGTVVLQTLRRQLDGDEKTTESSQPAYKVADNSYYHHIDYDDYFYYDNAVKPDTSPNKYIPTDDYDIFNDDGSADDGNYEVNSLIWKDDFVYFDDDGDHYYYYDADDALGDNGSQPFPDQGEDVSISDRYEPVNSPPIGQVSIPFDDYVNIDDRWVDDDDWKNDIISSQSRTPNSPIVNKPSPGPVKPEPSQVPPVSQGAGETDDVFYWIEMYHDWLKPKPPPKDVPLPTH